MLVLLNSCLYTILSYLAGIQIMDLVKKGIFFDCNQMVHINFPNFINSCAFLL